MWNRFAMAECIKGNCVNGVGTFEMKLLHKDSSKNELNSSFGIIKLYKKSWSNYYIES